MICDACKGDFNNLHGAIINGKYGQYCWQDIQKASRQASPGHAAFSREADRRAHQADMLQPWDSNGVPSTEFIRQYPANAKDMFSQEELERYG
jgi:hypothetical protein